VFPGSIALNVICDWKAGENDYSEEELKNYSRYTSLQSTAVALKHVTTAQDYIQNFSDFYATSPINALITIRGNPLIMQKVNFRDVLQHVSTQTENADGTSSAVNKNVKSSYRKWLEEQILYRNQITDLAGQTKSDFKKTGADLELDTLTGNHFTTGPVYCRVNIKTPNADYAGNPIEGLGDSYATDLILDDYFTIQKITNIIDRNSFTQHLDMKTQNLYGPGNFSRFNSQANSTKPQEPKKV